MANILHKTSVLLLLLTLLAQAQAGPRSGHRPKHHDPSEKRAREAGLASIRKVQLKQKLRQMHGHMRGVQARIHTTRVREKQLAVSVSAVEARLAHSRSKLAQARGKLRRLGEQQDQAEARLEATQERLEERRHLLAERLRQNYRRGQITYAEVLLQASSVHDLLARQVYVRQIVHSDTMLIADVRTDLADIETEKRLLKAQAERQERLAAEFEAEKARYADDLNTKSELLAQTRQTRQQAEEELDDLEEEAEAMTDRIRALTDLLRRRQEALAAARRAARQRQLALRRAARHHAPSRQQDEQENEPPAEEPEAPTQQGGFIRPSAGPITSDFGYRFHPILHRRKLHTGIDFGAPSGAPIRAAGSGTVILASYTAGYGNCVVIDHGGDTTTLYGHCSALLVSEGQTVHRGQLIARVGATGMATGPHLHFELRRHGVPVRPF